LAAEVDFLLFGICENRIYIITPCLYQRQGRKDSRRGGACFLCGSCCILQGHVTDTALKAVGDFSPDDAVTQISVEPPNAIGSAIPSRATGATT
jgi:hypothetical protein